MTKIALINDIHLGVKNDSIIFLEAHKKFFKEVFFPTLEKENITTVIILGDLFDRRKYFNYQTLYEVKKHIFDILAQNKITVYLLLGNHDVYFKNTSRINSSQLNLNEYPNIKVFSDPSEVIINDETIGLIPWINMNNEEAFYDFMNNNNCKLLFGHLEIKGFEMHRNGGQCLDGLDPKMFNKYEHVFSGHFHQPSQRWAIQYLGAPMQFTWADYDCKRGFNIWDFSTRELTFIENPDKMFHKIFYDNNIDLDTFDFSIYKDRIVKVLVTEKSDQHKLDLFIDMLQQVNPFQLDIIDNTMNQFMEDFDESLIKNEDTMALVSSYIDGLKLDFNSNEIKGLFKELYIEALAELD